MRTVTTVGLDIAKSAFQVHCVDVGDQVIIRRQLKRRWVLKVGRANSTQCRAGRSGDQDNPHVPQHCRMRAFDRDLIRGGHYGQRSCEPR
jgi:hypothetical protein